MMLVLRTFEGWTRATEHKGRKVSVTVTDTLMQKKLEIKLRQNYASDLDHVGGVSVVNQLGYRRFGGASDVFHATILPYSNKTLENTPENTLEITLEISK